MKQRSADCPLPAMMSMTISIILPRGRSRRPVVQDLVIELRAAGEALLAYVSYKQEKIMPSEAAVMKILLASGRKSRKGVIVPLWPCQSGLRKTLPTSTFTG